MPQKKMTYTMLDRFIELSKDHLPYVQLIDPREVSSIGYSLFWYANRKSYLNVKEFSLPVELPEKKEMLDAFLNLTIGIQYQGWDKLYESYYPTLIKMIKDRFSIVYLDDRNDMFDVLYLLNIYDPEHASKQYSNESIMTIIQALRRVDVRKSQYNARLIGDKIHTDIETLDYIKTIKSRNLPWLWITELNGWFSKLHEYDLLQGNWNDVQETLLMCFNENDEILNNSYF
ncbi:hypothetical protein [Marinilactibacillus psychrotolerans]|uniref:hypothetical protein n=1 Tax=Marinilactibacillus psychrotolerans TaxID=191770 RepID=UPI0037F63BB6